MTAAIAVITVLVTGCVTSTFAALRCDENIPLERVDGCRWLVDEGGWVRLPLYVSSLPIAACFVAYWRRSAWVVPVATFLAVVIAVATPLLVAG